MMRERPTERTRSLSDILCELITVRGYGRLLARKILENAWNTAIGEPHCRQTQVGEIRRGVLNVTVAHPSLLEELAAFRKATILAVLQASDLGTAIHDIQFLVELVRGIACWPTLKKPRKTRHWNRLNDGEMIPA